MTTNRLRTIAVGFIFMWFMAGGIAHFVVPHLFVMAIPPSLPMKMEAVYISGFFEILGAIGLLFPRWRRVAGLGLFALVICVSPANIYMWQNAELFPQIPAWFLSIRLLIQIALLWLIWWSTKPKPRYDSRL